MRDEYNMSRKVGFIIADVTTHYRVSRRTGSQIWLGVVEQTDRASGEICRTAVPDT